MATRTDYGKENRFRARKELAARTKEENGSPKSQTTAVSRRNITDSKTKRTVGTSGIVEKEERHKAYAKLGSPPKKVITSDNGFILPPRNVEKPRVLRKPVSRVMDKNKQEDEEKSMVNVSKLKHIFDETIANEMVKANQNLWKPRPKSEVIDRLKTEAKSNSVETESGRWSMPTYHKKTLPSTPTLSTHNHKVHVAEGIAARRALFERGNAAQESPPKEKRSPSLVDLVPGLKETNFGDEAVTTPRSRTRSDPGMKRPIYILRPRRCSPSDTRFLHDGTVEKLSQACDDSVLRNPPLDTRKLFKSKSAEHIPMSLSSSDSSRNEVVEEKKDEGVEPHSKSSNKGNEVLSGRGSKSDQDAPSPKARMAQRGHRKGVPKDDFFDETPGRIREAVWKDEEVSPEEVTHSEQSPIEVHDISRSNIQESQERDPHERYHLHGHASDDGHSHNEGSESSADESTGSVVEHSDAEEDSHTQTRSPVSLLFSAKPQPSVLVTHKSRYRKGRKNVLFAEDTPQLFHTYSAFEYDRGNEDIDPVTASAEWELEKRVEKMDIFSVDLEKDEKGLGLSIIGLGVGTDSGVEKLGIFVKLLTEGGAAEIDGRIQVNDQIIEVDGISLVGVTQSFAAQTLKNTNGIVRFLMGRDKSRARLHAAQQRSNPGLEQQFDVLRNKLIEAEVKAENAEKRALQAEEKLLQFQSKATSKSSDLPDTNQAVLEVKKMEKALSEMKEKVHALETDLAVLEAENEDMVKQLEESKGLYLILDKKYHISKSKVKEYEEKEEANAVASERSSIEMRLLQDKVRELETKLQSLEQLAKRTEEDNDLADAASYGEGKKENKEDERKVTVAGKTKMVGETVIINGEVLEVEQAPSRTGYDWNVQDDNKSSAGKSSRGEIVDLNCVPATLTLSNEYLLEKKRLAEAQQKKHKPTRASWAKSLDDDDDDDDNIFKSSEASDDEEDKETSKKAATGTDLQRMPMSGPGLILPAFPLGGFNLKSTGKALYDDDSSVRSKDLPPQETRASFPLSDKEKMHNVVVENLLEKQLSKADIKVSSLPTTSLDREGKVAQKAVDEEDSECFSGSTNSLDEIEEATRRIDSDLASSQASSRGSSPFLPPAMPLLQMKSVPVVESYNEAAIDVPPEFLAATGQSDSESPGARSNKDGQQQSSPTASDITSPGTTQLVSDWDTDQVYAWLVENDLEEYKDEFKNVDGKQLLNLDSSKLKAMTVSPNHRNVIKKKVKELKADMEKEQKARKQRDKEQKTGKKDGKFEKIGFMKKKGVYNIN